MFKRALYRVKEKREAAVRTFPRVIWATYYVMNRVQKEISFLQEMAQGPKKCPKAPVSNIDYLGHILQSLNAIDPCSNVPKK